MGTPLPPLLPDGATTLPASLPSRVILRDFALVIGVRPSDLNPSSPRSPADRRRPYYHGDLVLLPLQPAYLWQHLDEGEVQRCEVVEDVGLLLVSTYVPFRANDAENTLPSL